MFACREFALFYSSQTSCLQASTEPKQQANSSLQTLSLRSTHTHTDCHQILWFSLMYTTQTRFSHSLRTLVFPHCLMCHSQSPHQLFVIWQLKGLLVLLIRCILSTVLSKINKTCVFDIPLWSACLVGVWIEFQLKISKCWFPLLFSFKLLFKLKNWMWIVKSNSILNDAQHRHTWPQISPSVPVNTYQLDHSRHTSRGSQSKAHETWHIIRSRWSLTLQMNNSYAAGGSQSGSLPSLKVTQTHTEGSVNLNVNCVTAFTTQQIPSPAVRETPRRPWTEGCQISSGATLIIDRMIRTDEEIFVSKARPVIVHPGCGERSGERWADRYFQSCWREPLSVTL